MHKAIVNIKTEPSLKLEASKVAAHLGLPLGTVLNNYLRQFVREKRVVFEEGLTPNKKTAQQLRAIERDIKTGRNMSGPFSTPEEMDEHLAKL